MRFYERLLLGFWIISLVVVQENILLPVKEGEKSVGFFKTGEVNFQIR
jgi:hypothetical protein